MIATIADDHGLAGFDAARFGMKALRQSDMLVAPFFLVPDEALLPASRANKQEMVLMMVGQIALVRDADPGPIDQTRSVPHLESVRSARLALYFKKSLRFGDLPSRISFTEKLNGGDVAALHEITAQRTKT